jgi:hypothetical protein
MADVAEVVREFLELVAVVRDREVALNHIAKLYFKQNRALEFIVPKKALNVGPNGEGSGVGLVDEVEDALGDGIVEPIYDAAINLTPFGITVDDERWGADMADQTDLAQDGVDEAPPLSVVGLREIEEDRDVVSDIHGLDDGKGSRLRCVEKSVGGTGIRGGGRTGWRERHGAEKGGCGS